ncbi:MAG: class I SAM-dependent methyltransferase [Oscillospiraceae bacterium]|nr:class I SAM-dependent methyltransferase [Oscillospiraceae bacterium]MCL2278692.1 class I SAM-dependent methyltransferase [Oscillospiraceae bacterium]
MIFGKKKKTEVFRSPGTCPICEDTVTFSAANSWFRDHLLCSKCGSLPRERALMVAIDRFMPDWRNCIIHESSPAGRGVSLKLKREAVSYIESQFFPDSTPGELKNGFRSEDLARLTFEDNSLDIHITQDVMEHVFDIDSAFAEISRTLKPGGMHIFTVPLVSGANPTLQRASLYAEGGINYLYEPEYHGNPVSSEGSLVVWHWGYDIVHRIFNTSKMNTLVLQIDDISKGIRAEYIDVLVSFKN